MYHGESCSSPLREAEDGAKGVVYASPSLPPPPAAAYKRCPGNLPAAAATAAPTAAGSYKGAPQGHLSKPKLQFQTLVFKVQVHCDACIRKVKKAIASTDGVETIAVDVKQKRITVSGHMDQTKLLKKVAKTGKQVELVTGKDGGANNKSNNLADKPVLMTTLDTTTKLLMMNSSSMFPPPPTSLPTTNNNNNNNGEATFIFNDDNVNSCSIM